MRIRELVPRRPKLDALALTDRPPQVRRAVRILCKGGDGRKEFEPPRRSGLRQRSSLARLHGARDAYEPVVTGPDLYVRPSPAVLSLTGRQGEFQNPDHHQPDTCSDVNAAVAAAV
jgi:hypothetical protein